MQRSPPETSRNAFINRTNVHVAAGFFSPLSERKRHFPEVDRGARKRVKVEQKQANDEDSDDECSSDDGVCNVGTRTVWGPTTYGIRSSMMSSSSAFSRLPSVSTRPILQSFVSSNKADVFKCYSTQDNSFISLPYACSYSHEAKRGRTPLLAVATEQGTVHILNTSKRRDWDYEPQRTVFQPVSNGIFDVQWSPSDELLATASAGHSCQISCIESSGVKTIRHLTQGHTGTIKCVAWDPNRNGDVLSTGGRDGGICVWDLRVGRGNQGEGSCAPVIVIPGAHEENNKISRAKPKKGKLTPATPVRSITSLIYSEGDPYGLVSSGSTDGILRHWDLRLPSEQKRSSKVSKARIAPLFSSPFDPTTYQGTRRARGITSLSVGSGPSTGYLFALGNDSQVHTYHLSSLQPLSGSTDDADSDRWSYSHKDMRTNSFYVRTVTSPCGRWLASGGAEKGSVFLFDIVGDTASRWSDHPYDRMRTRGIQLHGQTGEVGAVDWADGMLATCADDGTVRIWRPDIEVYRQCEKSKEDMKWEWSWAADEQ